MYKWIKIYESNYFIFVNHMLDISMKF